MEVRQLPEEQWRFAKILTDPLNDPEVLKDTVDGLSDKEYAEFINDIADHVNELRTAKALVNQRIKDLAERENDFEDRICTEKMAMEKLLRLKDKRKVETELYTVSIQKNGGKEPLVIDADVSDIPEEYLIPQNPKPNNDKIRDLLKTETVPWAHLGERGESLRIK